MSKGLLFNALEGTFKEVEVKGLEDYYKHLNCRTIEVVGLTHEIDIYIDEEGRLKDNHIGGHLKSLYARKGNDLVLYGDLLFLSHNDMGETRSLTEKHIEFIKNQPLNLHAYYAHNMATDQRHGPYMNAIFAYEFTEEDYKEVEEDHHREDNEYEIYYDSSHKKEQLWVTIGYHSLVEYLAEITEQDEDALHSLGDKAFDALVDKYNDQIFACMLRDDQGDIPYYN